jgi:hypothetical protein
MNSTQKSINISRRQKGYHSHPGDEAGRCKIDAHRIHYLGLHSDDAGIDVSGGDSA